MEYKEPEIVAVVNATTAIEGIKPGLVSLLVPQCPCL
jgi:hypothetical protein